MKRWLAVSLLIPKRFEEPISNFLIEQGATGVEEVDEGHEWERLKTYFLQDGRERGVLRALDRYLRSLKKMDPELSKIKMEIVSIPEQDWGENWKKFFKPLRVGSRFVVKPPWSRIRLKRGEIPIEINPGMAFGTGTHATTKLCMEALEKNLKKELFVLDVGTGSGILAVAAAKLGAREVWGIDIDKMAVEIARENVSRNRVSDKVRIKRARIGKIQKRFDIVVANLDFRSLMRMRAALMRHLKKGGFLILSGVLEKEEERLRQHYMETGFLQWVDVAQEEEWVCLTFRKK
ncbi:MAG: 50S ribosomal protein L11 methyltransferase [Thermodesulfobacteriota bacterium]|nr:50S ribosomal protein L11 methyltransferase [Thermodesulfobacteriota bacterium]